MKNIVATAALIFVSVLASTLTSSVAFAYPSVNDSVTYQGSYAEQGQTYPVTLVTALKQFNATTGQFLQTETQTIAGQVQTQDTWVDQGDLITPAQVQNLVANCQAQGGSLEVVTIAAGAFNTCKLTQSDADTVQTYWFADVPFGIAQFNVVGKNEDGNMYQIALKLNALTRGQ